MKKILSIDGGGIRGIIPAAYLAEIEKRTGKPICTLFDLIAGTSTGGILAAALTVPDSRGRPKNSAKDVYDAYIKNGAEVFRKRFLYKLRTLNGLAGPSYSPQALKRMLTEFLGNARLHMTLTDVLITSYDMSSSTPWFFKSAFARKNRAPADDPLLKHAVLATAAAPTFFPPVTIEGHCLIDGGVFASNPALCAYAEVKKMYPSEKDILIVSLGTGVENNNRTCRQIDRWGIMSWAVPITGIMLNSSSATVDYQLRALAGTQNYTRFQVKLKNDAGMDDASEKNIRKLESIARSSIAQESDILEKLCRRLKESI